MTLFARISALRLACLPCLCCAFLSLATSSAQVPIPETPAGKTLSFFFDAFNRADKTKLEAYVSQSDASNTAENWLAFESQTSGFTLLSIETSAPDAITFRVKGRS